ncbi:hypothetical protein KBP30_03190 [Streptomyces sp. Go40/10]|uniref:hypothetical protein n=1 Tax=Streptomyces sp. Go40/10 TaxID=2825844 RepID=UPI001E609B15|nr:hypothetical protein [Streptomyces sp. Go40/10]UFR00243.1 hypothetical protein KBP30_03190 [Streptomyces sp. Go40/10]
MDMEMRAKKAVARICETSDGIRRLLDDPAPLDAVLGLLRSGGGTAALTGPLDALDNALLQAGDELGLYGEVGRGPLTVPSGGLGPARRTEIVFHCPRGRCARMVRPDATLATRPRCTLFDEDLAWIAS